MIIKYSKFINESQWDSIYQNYDIKAPRESEEQTLLNLTTVFPRDSRILDIGCGNGQDSLFLGSNGFDVYSTDISGVLINKLKSHYEDGKWIQHDILDRFPFENNFFSLAFSRLSLHYFSKDQLDTIFGEIYRIISPSGRFWFSVKLEQDNYANYNNLNTGYTGVTKKSILTEEDWIDIATKHFKLKSSIKKSGILYGKDANWLEVELYK